MRQASVAGIESDRHVGEDAGVFRLPAERQVQPAVRKDRIMGESSAIEKNESGSAATTGYLTSGKDACPECDDGVVLCECCGVGEMACDYCLGSGWSPKLLDVARWVEACKQFQKQHCATCGNYVGDKFYGRRAFRSQETLDVSDFLAR